MTNISVLSNVKHKDLKVIVDTTEQSINQVNRSVVFVTEIADLHKEFPILISKDTNSSKLQLHAILGFEVNENLFYGENGWSSRFVPALLARGPFSLGYPSKEAAQSTSKEPVICVDVDDSRVNTEQGESLFLPFGGETPYLQYVKKSLQSIELGMQYDQTLFAMIEEFDLLESVAINIKLSNVDEVSFNSYYTIDQQKLSQLQAPQLATLSQSGVLSLLYFIVSSMNNFQYLIDLKSKQSGEDVLSTL